jgi:hypothetical protein
MKSKGTQTKGVKKTSKLHDFESKINLEMQLSWEGIFVQGKE